MTISLTRRTLLASGAAMGALAVIDGSVPRVARAVGATGRTPNRVVVVFLRGAADHLSMTVPLDEAAYHDARSTIAIEPDSTLPLDDRFGFHPTLRRLHDRYLSGQLAPIVAVGNPAADRSHFLAQDLLERGSDGNDDLANGWLARHLVSTPSPADAGLRAITVGANVDESLVGYPALGMLSLSTFGFATAGDLGDDLARVVRLAHDGGGPLDDVALRALDAADTVAGLPRSRRRNRTAAAFEDLVTLLDADLGIEVITVNVGGWDTHDGMGTADEGRMFELLTGLDDTLGGLADSLDARGIDDVATVVVTEFGRRVAENGSGGTDHGWGSAALVLGNDVAGGRVVGDWPGLSPDVVADARGDVPMTTDYRDVLAEVIVEVLGGDAADSLPGFTPTPLGLFA